MSFEGWPLPEPRAAGAAVVGQPDRLEVAVAGLVAFEVSEREQKLAAAGELEVGEASGADVLVDRPAAPDAGVSVDDLGEREIDQTCARSLRGVSLGGPVLVTCQGGRVSSCVCRVGQKASLVER